MTPESSLKIAGSPCHPDVETAKPVSHQVMRTSALSMQVSICWRWCKSHTCPQPPQGQSHFGRYAALTRPSLARARGVLHRALSRTNGQAKVQRSRTYGAHRPAAENFL